MCHSPCAAVIREILLLHKQHQKIIFFKLVDLISALTVALNFQIIPVCSLRQ